MATGKCNQIGLRMCSQASNENLQKCPRGIYDCA